MAEQTFDCPIAASLSVIGGKWTILVLWNLMEHPMRTGELRRAVGEVSEKMLIRTLRDLEGHGMVERIQYPEVPPRVEYKLTHKAELLLPALKALCDWGTEHSGLYRAA
ncbi:MAG: helix-turn-helix domain-containing protein [Deinococcota bacterium]